MGNRFSNKALCIYACVVVLIFVFIVGSALWLDANSARVPILMYHGFVDDGGSGSLVSAEVFKSHIKALEEAGFATISFDDLYAFVTQGATLPAKPVIITMDDGYMSVYDIAFPILREHGMKATAFVIGAFYGESVYKGADYLPVEPYFGDVEAQEMVSSGVFSIQSHSYDMHQYIPYEVESPRVGILRRDGESHDEYVDAFVNDYSLSATLIENAVGARPFVYSYPYGRSTRLAGRLLEDMGIAITVTIAGYTSSVIRNSPKSLQKLGRITMTEEISADDLISKLLP